VLEGHGLSRLQDQLEKARIDLEVDPSTAHVNHFPHLQRFEAAGGYSAESEVRRLAAGVGLGADRLDLPLGALSGGERRRLELCCSSTSPPNTSTPTPATGSSTLHHSELPEGDVVANAGFRVTTPIRSLVDIAALAPDEDQLSRTIKDAHARGLVTARALRARAEQIDPRAALYIERALSQVEVL
jgi:hypothetical protein